MNCQSATPSKFHCSTCGLDYESTTHVEDCMGELVTRQDTPHNCKLHYGRFFERTEKEFEYREGILYWREVTYRKYSGHDTSNVMATTSWVRADKPWQAI